jgi:hypothetical protein
VHKIRVMPSLSKSLGGFYATTLLRRDIKSTKTKIKNFFYNIYIVHKKGLKDKWRHIYIERDARQRGRESGTVSCEARDANQ